MAHLYQSYGRQEEAQRIYAELIRDGWSQQEIDVSKRLLIDTPGIPVPTAWPEVGGSVLSETTGATAPAVSEETGMASLSVPVSQRAAAAIGKPGRLKPERAPENVPPASPPSPVSAAQEEIPAVRWMESLLPRIIRISADNLSRQMEIVGEDHLMRVYTEKEFRQTVLQMVEVQMPGRLTDVSAEIHPDGILGKAKVMLGKDFSLHVLFRVGINLVDEKPHVIVREVQVEGMPMPEDMCKLLEMHVNDLVDRQRYPLQFSLFELREGSAVVSVDKE